MKKGREKGWLYVAPQRIRSGKLALPQCVTWEDHEALNYQRLARVFEFQGCVGFVGSGVSAVMHYPPWGELLPRTRYLDVGRECEPTEIQWEKVVPGEDGRRDDKIRALKHISSLLSEVRPEEERDTAQTEGIPPAATVPPKEKKAARIEPIQPTQAILLAEQILGEDGRKHFIEKYLNERFKAAEVSCRAGDAPCGLAEAAKKRNPFETLLQLPIRRFVTTNYDRELEIALSRHLGPAVWKESLSFQQTDQEQMAVFAVALASKNRNMIFHCHGLLSEEVERLKKKAGTRSPSALVLTDADYNHWYLSKGSGAYTFQRSMEVILQSNPLLFVGYSIADVDLLRFLRQANLRWESERIASNLFLFLRNPSDDEDGVVKIAKQVRLGVNLLPFPKENTDLPTELEKLASECEERQREWMVQPKVKPKGRGSSGVIMPRPSPEWAGKQVDPLFRQVQTAGASGLEKHVIERIDEAFEEHTVVALIGGAGSGKFLKSCQFVHVYKEKYKKIYVFHSYNNDDIYTYLKRMAEPLAHRDKTDGGDLILVVINNIDLLLGGVPGDKWRPPNKKVSSFLRELANISLNKPDSSCLRVLVTARSLDYSPVSSIERISRDTEGRKKECHDIERLFLEPATVEENVEAPIVRVAVNSESPFPSSEIMLDPLVADEPGRGKEFNTLRWWLQHDDFGLVLAARYLDMGVTKEERGERLTRLMSALQSNSSEMGTRVVRHVLRSLDEKGGRGLETLLWFLSCFNTPITSDVFDEVCRCCDRFLQQGETAGTMVQFDPGKSAAYRHTFLMLGVLQQIGPEPERDGSKEVKEEDYNYVVPPLVKRYFREIMERSQERGETREFGLHGILSKGPFNSPGCSKKPKYIFDHFAVVSFGLVRKCMEEGLDGAAKALAASRAAIQIRAVLDILRSNFACNSVPRWGEFRDYIDMLSITIDLLRNLARATGDYWRPGEGERVESTWRVAEGGVVAVASAEEMLHLYNELGLAYYQTGSVQDALRVWSLATDWRKVVSLDDAEQGEMYNATLNAHLGMAYMQLGRMQTARECFERAQASAARTEDPDLGARMEGMIARIDHFGGSVNDARRSYRRVIRTLGAVGNRRAQCHFMRHLASLELRFGDVEKARMLANKSMAIAAGEHAPDLVAFASELKGKIWKEKHEDRRALLEYRIALAAAEKLDIARLQIDILLGTAGIQFRIGDLRAARASAISALKKANEHLLVLRQVRALILLGKVAHASSEIALARSILEHARDLAVESRFRLTEYDAREALAGIGGL